MAQNHTPGIKITGDVSDPDFGLHQETSVNKSYSSSGNSGPKLSSVTVVNGAYPKHALVFDATSGHVRVTGESNVPFKLHYELVSKLIETLNQG